MNKILILFPFLMSFCIIMNAQVSAVEISSGGSHNIYQFTHGMGFNMNSNVLINIKSKPKLSWGVGVVLSNTYGSNNFSQFHERYDAYIGGLNYIDNPDGVTTRYFNMDNATYVMLKERGYLKHYRPEENYFHNYYIHGFLNFDISKFGKFSYELNTGLGIGMGFTSEQIGNWDGFYGPGPKNREEGTWILFKIERKTKHLYWNVNVSNYLLYSFNDNLSVFVNQTFSITPGMLILNNFFEATLTMVNVGIRANIE